MYLVIALRNTEIDLLKADPNDLNEKDKKTTRNIHRNRILEKFYAGQTDEKYVQDYYELLKKADGFMRNASVREKAIATDKHGLNVGQKDQYGRRYDHIGFFREGHKNAGKTMGEVIEVEMEERKTTDDDYEIVHIFNNEPIEVGLSKIDEIVDGEYNIEDLNKKSKTFEFPIKIYRENKDIVNKIEQLTEFLHVKDIGFENRQLEFFIPEKFKTEDIKEGSKIFSDLILMKELIIKINYNENIGFRIDSFVKRIKHKTYEVWKFHGVEMKMYKK